MNLKFYIFSILLFLCLSSTEADTLSIEDSVETATVIIETVYVNTDTICAYGRDEILSFADHLFGLCEYDRASVEYLRLSFLYTDEHYAETALFKAGYCKEKAGDFAQARNLYQTLATIPNERGMLFAAYRIPLTYLLENQPDSALAAIDTTIQDFGASEYLRGWIYLRQKRYSDAYSVFEKISRHTETSDVAGSIDYLLHRSRQGQRLSHRSPFVAGLLSAAVPGLGRGYCGRWDDGFFSFLIIGVTGSLTYFTWENDRNFASVMAVFAGFFYLGNIYGSARGVGIYNRQKDGIFWKTTWEEVPHPPTMLYSSPGSEGFQTGNE